MSPHLRGNFVSHSHLCGPLSINQDGIFPWPDLMLGEMPLSRVEGILWPQIWQRDWQKQLPSKLAPENYSLHIQMQRTQVTLHGRHIQCRGNSINRRHRTSVIQWLEYSVLFFLHLLLMNEDVNVLDISYSGAAMYSWPGEKRVFPRWRPATDTVYS